VFGVIKNHSFHNGNKRTGLLSMIKHLYINGYVLSPSLNHHDIYNFILAISDDKLFKYAKTNNKFKKWLRVNKIKNKDDLGIDAQINFIEHWIKSNSVSKNIQLKGNVKLSKLKSILDMKGIKMEQNGAKINVFKEVDRTILGL